MTTQTRPRKTARVTTQQQINSSWTADERTFRRHLAVSRQSRFLTLVGLRSGQDRD